ncbi:hypothetical protein [Lacticaseibacillus sp. 866-1]|nr:hypothetical protein [Lacticaseibacillus sp. 866-1]
MDAVTIVIIDGSRVSELNVIDFFTVEEAADYFAVLINLFGTN